MPENHTLIPNSTQFPNVLTDKLLPRIPEAEHRCLDYIVRRTFGFKKKRDRIAISQFVHGIKNKDGELLDYGAGLNKEAVVVGLRHLVASGVISAHKEGKGRGTRVSYEINLEMDIEEVVKRISTMRAAYQKERKQRRLKQGKLFPRLVGQTDQSKNGSPAQPIKRSPCTTSIGSPAQPVLVALANQQNKGNQGNKEYAAGTPAAPKPKSLHWRLLNEYWYPICQRARGVKKPVVTKQDAKNLKRVIDLGIYSEHEHEMHILIFLAHSDFKKFAPSISTAYSSGILNGIQNRMKNDPRFWQELDNLAQIYLRKPVQTETVIMVEKLARLKEALVRKTNLLTPQARTEAQMVSAVAERAAA